MRTVGSKWVGLVVTSVLVAAPAFAGSDVDKELAEMRDLVKGLEQRVQAQEEQLEHQNGELKDAQKVVREQEEHKTLSGVSEFWQAIDVNASVAGSYNYNFKNPGNGAFPGAGANTGNSGLFYPFHPDHNSFQVDQVWFDIGKVGTEESRAGFHTTILYGTTAGFLGQGGFYQTGPGGLASVGPGGIRRNFASDGTSDYYVHQAYVSYLAPLGEGVNVQFGKFATLVGAEVADASKNWQITRGNLYNLLQPIDHLGILTSTTIGPVSLAAGVVNEGNLTVSSPDINKEKTYIGKVGIGNDKMSFATNVVYGAEGVGAFVKSLNGTRTGLFDALATFNSDAFSAWANADYAWVEGSRAAAWGFAVAGMVPLTDVFSAALRLEYLRDKEAANGGGDPFAMVSPFRHSEIYGATGTLAYKLAENLTVKTEVRWDRVVEDNQGVFPDEFITNTSGGDKDQVVGLAQVIYAF
jgi:putative OmpL-like beta-barrel porin-2